MSYIAKTVHNLDDIHWILLMEISSKFTSISSFQGLRRKKASRWIVRDSPSGKAPEGALARPKAKGPIHCNTNAAQNNYSMKFITHKSTHTRFVNILFKIFSKAAFDLFSESVFWRLFCTRFFLNMFPLR